MPGFTIKNFKDLEDVAGKRAAGIEGRFARSQIDSEHLGVSYFRYSPGVQASVAHSHREQEEVYVVLSGSGRMKLDDEVRDIRAWDVIRVSPETVRAFAAGDDGLEFVAVGSDRPEGGDGVMAPIEWDD